MSNEDDLLVQFIALYAKASNINVAELRRLDDEKRKREGTRLECPTVPRVRKRGHQVYREMGKNYFRRSFRMPYPALCCLLRPQSRDALHCGDAASLPAATCRGGEQHQAPRSPPPSLELCYLSCVVRCDLFNDKFMLNMEYQLSRLVTC